MKTEAEARFFLSAINEVSTRGPENFCNSLATQRRYCSHVVDFNSLVLSEISPRLRQCSRGHARISSSRVKVSAKGERFGQLCKTLLQQTPQRVMGIPYRPELLTAGPMFGAVASSRRHGVMLMHAQFGLFCQALHREASFVNHQAATQAQPEYD